MKVFNIGDETSEEDLFIKLDLAGVLTDPFEIKYTLKLIEKGIADPLPNQENRVPAKFATGHFFVDIVFSTIFSTGDYIVQWLYKQESDSPLTEDVVEFQLLGSKKEC